jgi:hypothetical protein
MGFLVDAVAGLARRSAAVKVGSKPRLSERVTERRADELGWRREPKIVPGRVHEAEGD